MEIPYNVKARPDTGLYNAKVGIWLFLASEVMLFGGLFSSYVFLRLGADFPWPFHELVVLPGFINTMVLIGSSVTVVAAWAALKARRYGWYQINMLITLLCAVAFMVIKGTEYYGKFTHYAITLSDGTIIEGHPVHHDAKTQGDHIGFGEVKGIAINLDKDTADFLKHLTAGDGPENLYGEPASREIKVRTAAGNDILLTKDWLKQTKKAYSKVRILRSKIATLEAQVAAPKLKADELIAAAGQPNGKQVKEGAIEKLHAEQAELQADSVPKLAALHGELNEELKANKDAGEKILKLEVVGKPLTFLIGEKAIHHHTADSVVFRDDTTLTGKIIRDDILFNADNIDLRQVKDPEKSHAWLYYPDLKDDFLKLRDSKTADFKEHHKSHAADYEESPDWRRAALRLNFKKDLPEEEAEALMHDHHKSVSIPRSDKRFYTNFSPSRSPYYAIYFLMTGLHGLHVIGGAIVLGYFLLFGRKMYLEDPEHLANRIEVGGLFWHFVDLVWIFLFPVFYLM